MFTNMPSGPVQFQVQYGTRFYALKQENDHSLSQIEDPSTHKITH